MLWGLFWRLIKVLESIESIRMTHMLVTYHSRLFLCWKQPYFFLCSICDIYALLINISFIRWHSFSTEEDILVYKTTLKDQKKPIPCLNVVSSMSIRREKLLLIIHKNRENRAKRKCTRSHICAPINKKQKIISWHPRLSRDYQGD